MITGKGRMCFVFCQNNRCKEFHVMSIDKHPLLNTKGIFYMIYLFILFFFFDRERNIVIKTWPD